MLQIVAQRVYNAASLQHATSRSCHVGVLQGLLFPLSMPP